MEIRFNNPLATDKAFVLQCVYALYAHDDAGEAITEAKFNNTWEYVKENPKNAEIIVFKQADLNVGYAILVFQWSNEFGGIVILLDEFFIIPDFRSKGIGKLFLNYLKETNTQNFKAIQLEVAKNNTKAIAFYAENEFKEAERLFLRFKKG